MSDRCDPDFAPLIGSFDRTMLAEHPGAIIGLFRGFRIGYLNAAWDQFAAGNGGQPAIQRSWNLGAPYLDAINGELAPYYRELLEQARWGGTLNPTSHVYECSSATRYRRFHMTIYGLSEGGLLVVNSALSDRPHVDREPVYAPSATDYTTDEGVVLQCDHCRRVSRPGAELRWDWIPEWVDQAPPNAAPSICDDCFGHYFGAETA
jgi:hypothetical protein